MYIYSFSPVTSSCTFNISLIYICIYLCIYIYKQIYIYTYINI